MANCIDFAPAKLYGAGQLTLSMFFRLFSPLFSDFCCLPFLLQVVKCAAAPVVVLALRTTNKLGSLS